MAEAITGWPDDVYTELDAAGIRQVSYVPDAGHSRLIQRCRSNRAMRTVSLTTEEEGVAMGLGAWLGGVRHVLLLQSSGVGNTINMLAAPIEMRVPLLMLVTMRGEWAEFNPWQLPMGQGTRAALESVGTLVYAVDRADEIAETVAAAARIAFNTGRVVAVLIGQRAIGAKTWNK
ncbi:MAG: phosphonopyruvate decarboxylase [Proteobacteria bacterium]|nr:phosphonopyruvate decarboxylase [Burkholderiales bacterium]